MIQLLVCGVDRERPYAGVDCLRRPSSRSSLYVLEVMQVRASMEVQNQRKLSRAMIYRECGSCGKRKAVDFGPKGWRMKSDLSHGVSLLRWVYVAYEVPTCLQKLHT